MGARFPHATLHRPGNAPRRQGTLAIENGELLMLPDADAADPASPGSASPDPFARWPIPHLADPPTSPALRVLRLATATAIQVGPLDALCAITFRDVPPEALESALAAEGYPAAIGPLTRAALELRALRSWGILFIMVGLATRGSTLINATGAAMTAVGLWALLADPSPALLVADGLLLALLAAVRLHATGAGLWPLILLLLGLRQLLTATSVMPILRDPAHRAWLRARLAAPPSPDAAIPAGPIARTLAFFLSVIAGASAGLTAFSLAFAPVHSPVHTALICAVSAALSLWYLYVCLAPSAAIERARRILPSSTPLALLAFPLWIATCVLLAGLRYLAPLP